MKFTKFTSAVATAVTVLASLAVVAPAAVSANTAENNAAVNGGQALPQNGKTKVGISFGQTQPTGNTGYLRLQQVPELLDFGNHERFDGAYPNFDATGANLGQTGNDRFPNYKSGSTNQTAILNTSDTALANVNKKAWATVVDKQDTRTAAENALDGSGKTDSKNGSWTLSVKADGPLALLDDNGAPTSETTDANLSFANTAYGQTADVFGLTTETQDQGYTPSATLVPVSSITPTIAVSLSTADQQHVVAKAAADEGAGADVFGWSKNDIRLNMPSTFAAKNGIYESSLTWTLDSGL